MAQVEKSVTFLGTPLQFVAIVSGLVFRDGMGDPVNLPPFLDDLRRRDVFLPNVKTWTSYPPESPPVNPNGPLQLDPNRQQITLERSWHDDLGHWVSSWTVTATGKGLDKSDITIPCDGRNWAMIEEGWNWLVSELAARGRIEGNAAPEQQPAPAASNLEPEQEATMRRLWPDGSYTYAEIADAMKLKGQGEFVRKTGYKMGLGKRKVGRKKGGN